MTAGELNIMKMLMQVLANQMVLLGASDVRRNRAASAHVAEDDTLKLINHAKEIMGR